MIFRLTFIFILAALFSCSSNHKINYQEKHLAQDCDEIINYLKNNNWRKHITDNAYIINGTFSSFYKILDSNQYCYQLLTVEDMIYTFGKPTSYPKEKFKGSEINTYKYLILDRDSIPRKKQEAYHYVFRDTLGNGTVIFPKDIEVVSPPIDMH